MTPPTTEDLEFAQRLPDAFLELPHARAVDRVSALVDAHWPRRDEARRRQLGQTLVLILTPLLNGAAVTGDVRQQCVEAVLQWIAQLEQ